MAAPIRAEAALLERCRDRGFTPGARDVAGLLALWREVQRTPAQAKLVAQALSRGEQGVARKLEQGLAEASGAERALRLRALARIGRRVPLAALPGLLDLALHDPEPRVVREAVRAVGKLEESRAAYYEDELVRVAKQAALPEQRAAVEALGLSGASASLELLRELAAQPQLDAQLAQRIARARTMIERRAAGTSARALTLTQPLPSPQRVRLRCRGGAEFVADEVRALLSPKHFSGLVLDDPRTLTLRWSGPLSSLAALRTNLDWGLVFTLPAGKDLAARIIAGVEAPVLVRSLEALTDGPVRFRLSLARSGSRRALMWRVAQALDARGSALRNDSRAVSWSVEVDEGRAQLICLPRHPTQRFVYREAHIPASSHPTLAALMARVAAPRRGELVWDPFCGCAAELIECSRLAEELRLVGSDHDPGAIAAARTNVAAAGLVLDAAQVSLAQLDAYAGGPAPRSVDIVITNPPMGRRTALGDAGLHSSLRRFVARAAQVLAPGGRLVWVTPAAQVSAEAGLAAGLRVTDHCAIDMSGMHVVLQELQR